MSWIAQRESIIKDYPECRICGEKTTNINSDLIIIGVDTTNGKTNNSFYTFSADDLRFMIINKSGVYTYYEHIFPKHDKEILDYLNKFIDEWESLDY